MTENLFDLEKLAWRELSVLGLGAIKIPLFSDDFSKFARSHREVAGLTFVRELLVNLGRHEPVDAPVDASEVVSLGTETLNSVATELLAAGDRYFRPKHIATGEGKARRIRRRKDEEITTLEMIEGEEPFDRLMKVLRAWLVDQDDAQTLERQRMQPAVDRLQRDASAVGRLMKTDSILSRVAKTATDPYGLGATARLARDNFPAYRSPAFEAIRALQDSPVAAILAQGRSQSAVANALRINDTISALKTSGVLASFPMIAAAARTAALRPNVNADLVASIAASARYSSILKVSQFATSGLLADQAGFTKAINRRFDLGITSKMLSTISAFQASAEAEKATRSVFPPGYQLAAAIGLESTRVRGLTADVLRNYGQPSDDTPLFAIAAGSAELADTDTFSQEDGIHYLAEAATKLATLAKSERDPVKFNALVALLTLVLTIFATAYGVGSYHIAKEQLALDREEAASGEANHQELIDAIRASHAELDATRQRAQQDRHLRYVHNRATLRVEPHAGAPAIRLVYPDQVLRVIEDQGDWLKVEVFDYQSDSSLIGWVSRRRVRIQPLD